MGRLLWGRPIFVAGFLVVGAVAGRASCYAQTPGRPAREWGSSSALRYGRLGLGTKWLDAMSRQKRGSRTVRSRGVDVSEPRSVFGFLSARPWSAAGSTGRSGARRR